MCHAPDVVEPARRPPGKGWRAALLGLGLLCAGAAGAQTLDPLALVPDNPAPGDEADAAGWHASGPGLRLELAREQQDWGRPPPGAADGFNRAVLDFRREWRLPGGPRLTLSNRLERRVGAGQDDTRNALREAYASVEAGEGWFVDLGRINWRNGVGSGFNPTDYLRRGASLDLGSQDPRELRENRLGTVMLRQQWVGSAGSAQLALIPALADGPEDSLLAPGWSRTNRDRAALFKLSPTLDERGSVDLLAFTRAGEGPQAGINLTRLVGDAWVLHAEYSAGRRAPAAGAPTRQGSDSSLGLSWTTPLGAVLTVEHQHDGAIRQRAWFARLAWDDAFGLAGVDLSAFARGDLDSSARRWQVDLAWALNDRDDLRLRWGGNSGPQGAPSLLPWDALPRHALSLSWVHAF